MRTEPLPISAVRFCGSTFSYTAVSVLLNYSAYWLWVSASSTVYVLLVSPPHVVGFANGVAQSTVSLARFVGPILGGTVRRKFYWCQSDLFLILFVPSSGL